MFWCLAFFSFKQRHANWIDGDGCSKDNSFWWLTSLQKNYFKPAALPPGSKVFPAAGSHLLSFDYLHWKGCSNHNTTTKFQINFKSGNQLAIVAMAMTTAVAWWAILAMMTAVDTVVALAKVSVQGAVIAPRTSNTHFCREKSINHWQLQ